MKEILLSIVEKMFEKVPFSKKEEELKKQLSDKVLEEYTKSVTEDMNNEISKAGELISHCNDVQTLCDAVGVSQSVSQAVTQSVSQAEENKDIENRGVLGSRDAKRIVNRLKRYSYVQSLCIAVVIQFLVVLVFNFSISTLLSNGILSALFIAGFFVITRKKQQYRAKCGYENLEYDQSGRDYFYRMNDKYSKKLMNTTMAGLAILTYIVFAVVLSVISSMYSLKEVSEQITYMGFFLEAAVFIHCKNYFCKHISDEYFVEERRIKYNIQLRFVAVISAVYFAAAAVLMCVFRNHIENIYNWVLVLGIIYFVGCMVYNLTARKQIVFRNIVLNIKKVVCISMVCVSLLTYNVMSMDFYFTQPFINKVSRVLEKEDEISYNEENGVYSITTSKEDFKILQLTDIHLGGSILSISKDTKALEACYDLIKYTKPDLVVVTGDMVFPMGVMSFSLNNNAPIMQFANFMRNTGIPWAFTYGNHDTEKMATLNVSEFDSLMKALSFKSSDNLLYPYIQPDIYGRSNQMIEIRNQNGSLRQALFLLDSNDYIANSGKINEYDYIHDDQVEWYKKNVLALSAKEGHTIPSLLFFHIPLQEYREANDLYESGSSEVKYYYGILGEKMIDKICCSKYPSKLFSTAVELGSTKAMFCGHDHYNNQSLEYQGIRLTYGYSIDYLAMPGIEEQTEQRGATLITLDRKGDFQIDPYRLKDL